jgi:hypothetical protein
LISLIASSTATTLVLAQLPAHTPLPVDRAQTFLYFLLLALFLWTILVSHSNLLRPVALGLGLYASISLAAQAGRTIAAIHRDASAYARWSYTSAAGYILVVALWLLTLKLQPPSQASIAAPHESNESPA